MYFTQQFLFVLNGACLSITLAIRCFQKSHISFELLCVVTRFQSIMRRSRKNSASLKFLSCRTSILEHIIFNILERRWVTLRIRKIAEWSLIPILMTPDLGIENGNLLMPENLVMTSAYARTTVRTDSGSRGKKLSRIGKWAVPDMYVTFRFGAKITILGATNGFGRVKIWIEVSCVRLTTTFSQINFLSLLLLCAW